MEMYKILSILLSYPRQEWLMHTEELSDAVNRLATAEQTAALKPFFAHLRAHDEISLQEVYVDTFDRSRSHALHLFEHLHGEDRARGQAMVDLLTEYQSRGLEPENNELPDYLPLFLEFLSSIDTQEAENLLADAVHVIGYIAENLHKSQSVYAPVMDAVVALSPVAPMPLQAAPVRNMDEALEKFGPTTEGLEPLLNQPSVQEVQFFRNKKLS
ncbi:nitrate reductase molybdenum cofactor assembly chaperone [Snodgrassella communis]|nr:nitrate reductase molybdenum cofactor assembly chaperone [Snodgrassella communis]